MSITRTFMLYKGGRRVEVDFKGSEVFRRSSTYDPIARDRIFAVDTESLVCGDVLQTVLIPIRYSTGDELLEIDKSYVRRSADGYGPKTLEALLASIHGRYSLPEERPSRTKQRSREDWGDRHGRRSSVNPVLAVFFNLPYDLGRLCADFPRALRALASGADSFTFDVGRFEVEVARMVLGHGASFEWFIRSGEGSSGTTRVTRLIGIDLVGYWKTSLAKAAKSLGVTEKIEIDSSYYSRTRESLSDAEWEEFKRYALGDVNTTLELYHATVELLVAVDARVVRRNGVVPPSVPGASARIAFAKAFDCHPDITQWRRYPAWADQMGCDAYFGGRSFCAFPGIHQGMRVRDLKSAYPFAMSLLPDPVDVRCEAVPTQTWSRHAADSLRGKFGVVYVTGEATDAVYPAFRTHDDEHRRLKYVYGKFHRMPMTIPELMIGVESGAVVPELLHKGVVMHGSAENSFLRKAILDYFAIKEDPRNAKPLQNMGKLSAVSLYGKLIEVMCGQYHLDCDVMCPPFKRLRLVADRLAVLYAETPPQDYDDVASEFVESLLIHRADCEEPGDCLGCGPEPIDDGPAVPIRRRFEGFRSYECGQYFMPLYAAQTTGLVSAMLGLMARVTQAAQGDTDSVHEQDAADDHRYYEAMARAGYPAPTDGLGAWMPETPRPTTESICLRPKVYSHYFEEPIAWESLRDGSRVPNLPAYAKVDEWRPIHHKQARHGFSRWPGTDADYHEALRRIAYGDSVEYQTRPAPTRLRQALRDGTEVGRFVSREIEVRGVADPNVELVDRVVRWKALEQEE